MVKIDSRDADHWCTSEDVRDLIQIPSKGTERDFEGAIESATNSVQAWWQAETGESSLPDASGLHDLLVEATAWLAVSEATFTYARNFGDSTGDSDRTRTAEDKAQKKFDQWTDVADTSASDAETDDDVGSSGSRHGSLIDLA